MVFVSLKDLMTPVYFDGIIFSVKRLCSFDELGNTRSVGVLSLALKLGYSVKKCIAILTGEAQREKDDDLLSDQQNLEKVMDSEWNDRISHPLLATHRGRKLNQVDILSLTEDLENLREHLLQKISALSNALKEKEEPTLHASGEN